VNEILIARKISTELSQNCKPLRKWVSWPIHKRPTKFDINPEKGLIPKRIIFFKRYYIFSRIKFGTTFFDPRVLRPKFPQMLTPDFSSNFRGITCVVKTFSTTLN
jgi:hypothetical protein